MSELIKNSNQVSKFLPILKFQNILDYVHNDAKAACI